jgi:hypothetical protein
MMSVVEGMVSIRQSCVPLLRGRACEASGSVQAKKKDGEASESVQTRKDGVVAARQQTKFALSWKQVPAVACRPDGARWI